MQCNNVNEIHSGSNQGLYVVVYFVHISKQFVQNIAQNIRILKRV